MRRFILCVFMLFVLCPGAALADSVPDKSTGQLVYVPAYAHFYHGGSNRPFYLSITLSLHNTDPKTPITVHEIDYYSTAGDLISRHVTTPVVLGPLATMEVFIEEKGKEGGSGDNFLVRWRAPRPVNPPLAETLMVGTASAQGISFTSRGIVIAE